MRAVVSAVALVGALIWSLLAWGAYAFVGWAGGLAAANADALTGDPETVEWLFWAASWLTDLGLFGVVALWVLGLVLILALPVAVRLARRRREALLRHRGAFRRPQLARMPYAGAARMLRSSRFLRELLGGTR